MNKTTTGTNDKHPAADDPRCSTCGRHREMIETSMPVAGPVPAAPAAERAAEICAECGAPLS